MLVLTRRTDQKIVFPNIGVTLQVLNVRGNTVKVGIKAPRDLAILRQEIADTRGDTLSDSELGWLSAEARHFLRNRLNTLTVGLRLCERQLKVGLTDDAEATLAKLLKELETLNQEFSKEKLEDRHLSGKFRCRTLLVEDNLNESELLAGYLRMSGCQVDTAGDGSAALEYLESHPRPDFVLLDMKMPRCDGPKTIELIRREPALTGLKVIAVSGTPPKELGVPTGPGGIDRWLPKPLDPEVLVRVMTRELAPTITA